MPSVLFRALRDVRDAPRDAPRDGRRNFSFHPGVRDAAEAVDAQRCRPCRVLCQRDSRDAAAEEMLGQRGFRRDRMQMSRPFRVPRRHWLVGRRPTAGPGKNKQTNKRSQFFWPFVGFVFLFPFSLSVFIDFSYCGLGRWAFFLIKRVLFDFAHCCIPNDIDGLDDLQATSNSDLVFFFLPSMTRFLPGFSLPSCVGLVQFWRVSSVAAAKSNFFFFSFLFFSKSQFVEPSFLFLFFFFYRFL